MSRRMEYIFQGLYPEFSSLPLPGGRLVLKEPVETQLPHRLAKLMEVHGLTDVTVDAEIVTVQEIPLFQGGSEDHHGKQRACQRRKKTLE